MTTYVEARATIAKMMVDGWESAFPSVPVVYNNVKTKDLDKLKEFVGCNIKFMDSKQISVGLEPVMRVYGSVSFVIACKGGEGYAKSLGRADTLCDIFRFRKCEGLVFMGPRLLPPVEENDWFYLELVVSFFFDS